MVEKAKRTPAAPKRVAKSPVKRRSPLRFEPEPATGLAAWIPRESGPLQAARNSLRAGTGSLSRGAIAGLLALSLLFGAGGGAVATVLLLDGLSGGSISTQIRQTLFCKQ